MGSHSQLPASPRTSAARRGPNGRAGRGVSPRTHRNCLNKAKPPGVNDTCGWFLTHCQTGPPHRGEAACGSPSTMRKVTSSESRPSTAPSSVYSATTNTQAGAAQIPHIRASRVRLARPTSSSPPGASVRDRRDRQGLTVEDFVVEEQVVAGDVASLGDVGQKLPHIEHCVGRADLAKRRVAESQRRSTSTVVEWCGGSRPI